MFSNILVNNPSPRFLGAPNQSQSQPISASVKESVVNGSLVVKGSGTVGGNVVVQGTLATNGLIPGSLVPFNFGLSATSGNISTLTSATGSIGTLKATSSLTAAELHMQPPSGHVPQTEAALVTTRLDPAIGQLQTAINTNTFYLFEQLVTRDVLLSFIYQMDQMTKPSVFKYWIAYLKNLSSGSQPYLVWNRIQARAYSNSVAWTEYAVGWWTTQAAYQANPTTPNILDPQLSKPLWTHDWALWIRDLDNVFRIKNYNSTRFARSATDSTFVVPTNVQVLGTTTLENTFAAGHIIPNLQVIIPQSLTTWDTAVSLIQSNPTSALSLINTVITPTITYSNTYLNTVYGSANVFTAITAQIAALSLLLSGVPIVQKDNAMELNVIDNKTVLATCRLTLNVGPNTTNTSAIGVQGNAIRVRMIWRLSDTWRIDSVVGNSFLGLEQLNNDFYNETYNGVV